MLVKLLVDKKNEGADIEQLAEYAENTKLHVTHWFTVDDLKYLKAGGRISATTALLGGMLNIKPVMKVDENGKLISVSKAAERRHLRQLPKNIPKRLSTKRTARSLFHTATVLTMQKPLPI